MREKKDRVDDALQATKAAIEEGIVPGGGSQHYFMLVRGINMDCGRCSESFKIGKQIVYQACGKPFEQILN